MLAWAYNLGEGNLATSGLRRAINARQWIEAAAQISRWNKAGGRVLPGLVSRVRGAVSAALSNANMRSNSSACPGAVHCSLSNAQNLGQVSIPHRPKQRNSLIRPNVFF